MNMRTSIGAARVAQDAPAESESWNQPANQHWRAIPRRHQNAGIVRLDVLSYRTANTLIMIDAGRQRAISPDLPWAASAGATCIAGASPPTQRNQALRRRPPAQALM
jgi:hypothetical protein